MYIYQLNVGNNVYYGKTVNHRSRLNDHKRFLRNNKHHNRPLQNAYNKHKTIEMIILEENVPADKIDDLERKYIAENKCCNLMVGGEGRSKGFVVSEETKAKISKSKKGIPTNRVLTAEMHNKLQAGSKAYYDQKFLEKYEHWMAVKR